MTITASQREIELILSFANIAAQLTNTPFSEEVQDTIARIRETIPHNDETIAQITNLTNEMILGTKTENKA